MDDDDRVNHERALSSLSDVLRGLPERGRSTKWADSLSVTLYNRQTSGESASLPQYLGCNTVFDMRLRVTFLRRKTVSLQSNIAHRE
jgi:hypothetical protein